ncbi:MAG: 5-amino-6-(D-ribitylamino)uracil--L-tyrosine 4-hydroxyphenyl transferase CofH, partial [Xanthobacteraceae bacterium]
CERIESLLALRKSQRRYGHIQEIIIQNFRAKPLTRMASAAEPDAADHLWTIAVARILFGPKANIQAPPNLSGGPLAGIINAGINDWGGISPVTPDHVNPEAAWPALQSLEAQTAAAGKVLVERLAIYREYLKDTDRWLDPALRTPVRRASDSEGYSRSDDWIPGAGRSVPTLPFTRNRPIKLYRDKLGMVLKSAMAGEELPEADITYLFSARGRAFERVCEAADALRFDTCGDDVTYVVNRNINYTNICHYRCKFCAFSKGKLAANLRGKPYNIELEEIQRRSVEAWRRGATEVCLQGGIHPDYSGETYIAICRAIKEAAPSLHIHAFSPLEIWQGAATLNVSVETLLVRLKEAGLGTLPGTAAEILDDEIRAVICPDKLKTEQWLKVIETAHSVGLRTTSTVMFGHVDGPANWSRHLTHLRRLQQRTGGITEFVPLPFVPMETPIYLRGNSRSGPTFREAILMHAVARLALHPVITNVQASWVKLGPDGLAWCLGAGANDTGGTLMNESITRAAGATFGEELPPIEMEKLIHSAGRRPRQRTTLYSEPPTEQQKTSFLAMPLKPVSYGSDAKAVVRL